MNDNRVTWSSTNHPIADLKDWHNDHKIIIQPDYQRRLVWNQSAKIMLIDTILKNIPMPKIFLSKEINKTQSTVRKVIDGQQRINAILEFIDGKFYNGLLRKASLRSKIRVINTGELLELVGTESKTNFLLG